MQQNIVHFVYVHLAPSGVHAEPAGGSMPGHPSSARLQPQWKQGPQSISLPHPSPTTPHSPGMSAQVSGRHADASPVGAHLPGAPSAPHPSPAGQPPQSSFSSHGE